MGCECDVQIVCFLFLCVCVCVGVGGWVGTFLIGKFILFKVAFSTELIHDIVSFSKVSVY